MTDTACVGDVLKDRFHRNNSYRNHSNIEASAETNNLPTWLAPWAQNKSWAIRLGQLVKQGHAQQLHRYVRYLEENAAKINRPQNHFNKSWSRTRLSETIAFMNKLLDLDRRAAEVVQRLNMGKENLRPIYAACWRWGEGAIRHAVTAQETATGDLFKYFCWLTSPKRLKELRGGKT